MDNSIILINIYFTALSPCSGCYSTVVIVAVSREYEEISDQDICCSNKQLGSNNISSQEYRN